VIVADGSSANLAATQREGTLAESPGQRAKPRACGLEYESCPPAPTPAPAPASASKRSDVARLPPFHPGQDVDGVRRKRSLLPEACRSGRLRSAGAGTLIEESVREDLLLRAMQRTHDSAAEGEAGFGGAGLRGLPSRVDTARSTAGCFGIPRSKGMEAAENYRLERAECCPTRSRKEVRRSAREPLGVRKK
jgi:hypothetical protein